MKNNDMDRGEFIRRSARYLLFGLLAAIAAITGSRAAKISGCGECPGKGICRGEQDCSTYLRSSYGKRQE